MVNDENGNALPPGWVWVSIDEILNVNYGKGLTKSERDSSGVIPVYGSAGVTGYHSEALTAGATIIIGRKGAAGAVHLSKQPCWVIDTAYFIEPPSELSIDFLYYAVGLLNLNALDKSTAIPSLSRDDIYSQYIPIAPLAEQQRIVEAIEALFTRLDAGVATLKRLRTSLRRYKAAVLKAAAEGRLVEQDPNDEPASELLQRILKERRAKWEAEQRAKGKDLCKLKYEEPAAPKTDDLPDLPEGWVWATVEQVGEIQLGRQRAPRHHSGAYMRPYLRVANVFEDHIDTSDVLKMNFTPVEYETYRLVFGDVLLNEGQSLELVGRPAIYRDEVAGACFQNTLVRFRAADGVMPEYALSIFRGYLHNGRFQRIARWTTNIAHLGAGRFAVLEFPLPPTREQKQIVDKVEELLSVMRFSEKLLDHNLKRAERLRQAILREAFAGRLVPQDPDDEPASALLEKIHASRQVKKRNSKP